jgi:hypothetical protein
MKEKDFENFFKEIEDLDTVLKETEESLVYSADSLKKLSFAYLQKGLFEDIYFEQALEYMEKSVLLYEEVFNSFSKEYTEDLASSLFHLSELYRDNAQESKKAETSYQKSITLYRKLVKENKEIFLPELARALISFGNFYSLQTKYKKAIPFLKESLEIYRKLSKKTPEPFLFHRADAAKTLCITEHENNNQKEGEKLYEEALEIYKELAKKCPEFYEEYLAEAMVLGVDFFEKDPSCLEQAKEMLKKYSDNEDLKYLSKIIKKLEKRK